jgi:hypothetical protein
MTEEMVYAHWSMYYEHMTTLGFEDMALGYMEYANILVGEVDAYAE